MDNNTAVVIVAGLSVVSTLITAGFGWAATIHAKAAVASSEANAEKLVAIAKDVHTVEVATNSMKDELVRATAVAAKSEGREEERIAGEQKAADLIAGQRELPK